MMKRRELLLAAMAATSAFAPSVNAQRLVALDPQLRKTLSGLDGVTDRLKIQGGLDGHPVLVTFFASWCPPCVEEFHHLNKVHAKYHDAGLRIVGINVYEEFDENDAVRMKRFLEVTSPRFAAVRGNEAVRAAFGGIPRIPTVMGFSTKGALRYRFVNERGAVKTSPTTSELMTIARQLTTE